MAVFQEYKALAKMRAMGHGMVPYLRFILGGHTVSFPLSPVLFAHKLSAREMAGFGEVEMAPSGASRA